MHQQQLTTFVYKFELFDTDNEISIILSFISTEYEAYSISFFSQLASTRKLTKTQIKYLQQHYMTIYNIECIFIFELTFMNDDIQVWRHCQIDKTIFHCWEYQKLNSARLNDHLICIKQKFDINAAYKYDVREKRMRKVKYYIYIQFYYIHNFRNN